MNAVQYLRSVTILWAIFASISVAHAINADELMDDPALEAKAREISAELRCVVCQNQSIDDSDAPLARDLRLLVRERLSAGDGKDEVIAFLVARYGEFVLLRPPFSSKTILLWLAPLFLLGGGVLLAYRIFSQPKRSVMAEQVPLSADEKKRLDHIFKQNAQ